MIVVEVFCLYCFRLQDGVPQTIMALREAGLKVGEFYFEEGLLFVAFPLSHFFFLGGGGGAGVSEELLLECDFDYNISLHVHEAHIKLASKQKLFVN